MKVKWIVMAVLIGAASCAKAGTITWVSSDLGAGYTSGWLVALYEDVSKDGWDSTSINISNGSTGGDDTYLGITTSLTSGKGGLAYWGGTFSAPAGSLAFNDRVYSVLFNAPTMAAATQYKVTTMTDGIFTGGGNAWFQLPAADADGTYKTTTMSSFQAVPEPATFLLFGIGGMGAFLLRRKQQRVED